MFAAATAHDTAYAAFAASMLQATATEAAWIARYNASVTRYQGENTDTTSATIAPKGASK